MRGGIGRLFAGRAIPALLRLFLLNPTREYYQRELAQLIDERLFLVQAALARLSQASVIVNVQRGNRTYYKANQSHPAFSDLKQLILKTIGVGDNLREQLRPLGKSVKVAFIYGSVARGDEDGSSDVDLMLIGDVSGREVASLLAPVKREMNREVNASLYRSADIKRGLRARQPFIREVIEGPKIFLIGDEDALRSVLGRRSAQTA